MTRAQLGSIQRLDKDRYRLVVENGRDEDGKRQRKTKVIRGTREDAEIELARMKLDVGKPVSTDMTVNEFWATMYEPTLNRLSPSTKYGYVSCFKNYVQPLFGRFRMSELTTRGIERELWTIETPGAMHNAFKLLRQMYNQAYDWEMIESNPFSRRIKLKRKEHYEPETYTIAELREWVKIIEGSAYEPVLLVSAFGGTRREESTALYWDDIAFSEVVRIDEETHTMNRELIARVRICKAFQEIGGKVMQTPTKTPKSNRTIFIYDPIATRLKELSQIGHVPLVPDANGNRMSPNRIGNEYRKMMEKADFKYVPMKNLRTTYATIQQQLGTDSSLISSALGHSNFSTTYERYLATNEDSYIENARRLGNAF